MTRTNLRQRTLRTSTALQALALLGAGVGGVAMIAAPAVAQDYTNGALVGSVKDSTGATVDGGSVTVTSNEQGFSRTATIQGDGSFRVVQLPTGTYTVTVTPTTGQAISDNTVRVTAGSSTTYVFTIPVDSAAGNDIVVTGKAQKTNDFAANTTGLSVDVQQLIQTVPINRNATAIQLLAPGTVGGDNGFGNFASFSGATVAENQYYVNGLNITDFRNFIAPSTVPFEFYNTYNVQTGGLPAEYGRALGGVTSAVVKSGSNTFKAGAVFAFSPSELYEKSPNTYAARNSDDYNQIIDPTFYVSGPIIKDHLFFYGLYNPRDSRDGNTSITSGLRSERRTRTPFLGAKIDANIIDGQRLEFTYFRDKATTNISNYVFTDATGGDPSDGVVGAYSSGSQEKTGGNNFIATYTGTFTDWFTLSGSYGQNRRQDIFTVQPNQPQIQSQLTGAVTLASGPPSAGQFAQRDKREVFRVDADFYFNILGSHHIRVGYDNEDLTAGENTTYVGDYTYVLTSTQIRRSRYINVGSFESKQAAYYLQDSWSLLNDRLNLQLGIRNDHFKNYNVEGEPYFDQKNQWGPRLGASFDVFGDKRTKISGYWGRYFLPIATNTNIREAGAELFYQQRYAYPTGFRPTSFNSVGLPNGLPLNPDGSPVLGAPVSVSNPCPTTSPNAGEGCYLITSAGVLFDTGSLVASGLKPSYTDEWNVGLTHQLGDWTFGLRYINRRLGRTLEDIAVDAGINAYCAANNITGCDAQYTGFTQYVVSNPGGDVTVTPNKTIGGKLNGPITLKAADLGFPKPVRKYDAVEFTFDKPFDGKWSLSGSYTFTKLRGNYEGAVISSINQTDAGITQDYDQPGLLDGGSGDLPNNRKHAFKLFGAFSPFDGLLIGANAAVYSPRRFSCLGNYDSDGNPFGDDNFAYAYGAFSYYCVNPQVVTTPIYTGTGADGLTQVPQLIQRGTAFKSDWQKTLDLKVQYAIPSLPGTSIGVDVFNIFNWQDKLDFNEIGDLSNGGPATLRNGVLTSNIVNNKYRLPLAYTTPRSFRFTLTVRFGEKGNTETGSEGDSAKQNS